jgi:Haem-binding domain/Cytochrome P460
VPSRRGRTLVAGLVIAGLIAFVALQFVRPELPNSPATAELVAPPEVKQILETSCYDCHSNQTRVPWFDRIVPAYWLVVDDVQRGRARLNFSEIGRLPAAQQRAALYESVNQVRLAAMPPARYLAVHRGAALRAAQLDTVQRYLLATTPQPVTDPARTAAADQQYAQWTTSGTAPRVVRPAPNGIPFHPEYKDWRVVSSTQRFDNGTLRQVLGNDVAIKAIETDAFRPWPDGTMFAKIAWEALPGDDGVSHSGAFVQVELMIKDRTRYAGTAGWGWARWRGTDLQPYGQDATFTDECVGCHTPMRENDFVYSLPIERRGATR